MSKRFHSLRICATTFALLSACAAQTPRSNDGVGHFLSTLRQAQEASRAKQWTNSATLWQEVTVENPVTGDFWLQLASARYNAQDYRSAIAAYERAMSLGVNGLRSNIRYEISRCHARLGEYDKALEWLESAMKLGYRDFENAQHDRDLQSLNDNPKFRELFAMVDLSSMSRDEGWRRSK
jgi:tetratricopeptide (TPR) repeat protein